MQSMFILDVNLMVGGQAGYLSSTNNVRNQIRGSPPPCNQTKVKQFTLEGLNSDIGEWLLQREQQHKHKFNAPTALRP
jgi:hypothetical protein